MILKPRPHQVEGAEFLAARKHALLADDCRVGKSLATILACNLVGAKRIAVVTTKSGVPVWRRAFEQGGLEAPEAHVEAWSSPTMWRIGQEPWDVVIGDECHKASHPGAQRTRDFYGELGPDGFYTRAKSAIGRAERVWCLSATPAPHDNSNLYPILRALAPERLTDTFNFTTKTHWPEVRAWPKFRERYCVVGRKRLPNGEMIEIVVGSRNNEELSRRMEGFFLRRTQSDVGISEPTYDLLPLEATPEFARAEGDLPTKLILEAAMAGDTDKLDMHLGPLMRLTATWKAQQVAQIVRDEFEGGLDKIVLAYWHRDVGDLLERELESLHPLRLDGSTPSAERARIEERWRQPDFRVFLAQMEAAGEAIDLSAGSSMIIVEPIFRPHLMRQMALRITNVEARRTPLVRVATLAGSIDERVQDRLLSLWSGLREVFA